MIPLPTTSQRAGQMIITGIEGTTLTAEAERVIRLYTPGGIILFPRNYENPKQLYELIRDVRALSEEVSPGWPMFISVDQEGGKVARLTKPFTQFPDAGALGLADSHELAYRFGGALALELKSVGINMDYAPVLDVNTNPDNPIIGMRALSTDPLRAGVLGVALLNGMQDLGMVAVGKHFPGHGDTAQDSHLELPTVDRDRATLEQVELAPFAHAIENGLKAVMTAHVMYPALDDTMPATFSRKILKNLLRGELGFQGITISDDLEMKAIDNHYKIETLAGLGVEAGLDMFMICHNAEKVAVLHDTLVRGLEKGKISAGSVELSLERIGLLKKSLPKFPATPPCPEDWEYDHNRLAQEMAGFLST